MNNKDKISVVVPIYNIQNELPKCVQSILSQTYRNIEILLVDDGSTDSSRDVIAEFAQKDERIVPIYKQNEGVTSARLTGVSYATGEWIGFIDGDDYIDPEMYSFLLENAVKHQAEISHCGFQKEFPDGRTVFFYNTGDVIEYDQTTALKELLSGSRIEPSLCNKLFHRSLFHSLLDDHLIDLSIKINEDLLMNYYLFREASRIIYEDRCPYHNVARDGSASRRSLNYNKIFDVIKVREIIFNQCDRRIREDAGKSLLSVCIYVYCLLVSDQGLWKDEKKSVKKYITKYSEWSKMLSGRVKVLFWLITKIPHLFEPIYRVYSAYFQNNPYK